MKPNRENIQKWVDALRSGEYEQGKGQLKQKKNFCCLGVACEVSGLGKWVAWGRLPGPDAYGYEYETTSDSLTGEMPDEVQRWLGLRESIPDLVSENDELEPATYLNDDLGYTFAQIADAIERTYLEPQP